MKPRNNTYKNRSQKVILLAILTASPTSLATGGTWNGTVGDAWNNSANWSDLAVPAAAGAATFDNGGNGNTAIDLGLGASIKTLLFDTSGAAAYTIGSGLANIQTLTLNNTGSITVNATVASNQLFNAGIVLGTDGTAQTTTFTNNSVTSGLTFAGGITGSTGAGAKTLSITGAGSTTISGSIANGTSGTVKLSKSDTGTLTLNGPNTYTGTTSLTGGKLTLGNADSVKNSALTIGNATTLQLRSNSATTFNSSGAVALSNVASQSVTIDVNNNGANTGNTLTLANGISYNAPSVTTGTYTTTLNVTGANGYALGLPSVSFNNSNSYGSGQPRNFVLALNPTSASALIGNVTLTGGGGITRVTVALILDGTAIGNNVTGAVSLPAGRPVTKNGTGTWTLSGTSTYNGATAVNAGVLNITGAIGSSSAVSVGGATATGTPKLSGSGTVNGTVTLKSAGAGAAGILDAGDAGSANPAGKLTVNNNLTFESGSIFEWDIKDGSTVTTDAAARGVQYDAVDITGGGALSVISGVFRVVLNAGTFNTGNFWTTSRSWAWTSIFSTGSLANFTSLEWFEGSTLKRKSTDLAGRSMDGFFSINSSTSTLDWTAVPEPTSALAGLLITAGLLRRRRENS